MEPIPEPPISYCSPPFSPAPTFHHLCFPSLPPRSGRNPFPSLPSPTILLPPLPHHLSRTSLPPSPLPVVASQIWTEPIPEPPIFFRSPSSSPTLPLSHQPFTISASPSSPPRSERNPFSSPPSPIVLLPPLLHQPSTISTSRRCLLALDRTHSQVAHHLLFSSLLFRTTSPALAFHYLHLPSWTPLRRETESKRSPLNQLPYSPPSSPAPSFHHLCFPSLPPRSGRNPFPSLPSPLPHQPSTISASRCLLLDLDRTHSRAPHLLPFSSPSPAPPLSHQPFTISALPSLPSRSERNQFLSPPSPIILLPPLPHQPSTISSSRRRLPDLDKTHSQAAHLLLFSFLLFRTTSPALAFHYLHLLSWTPSRRETGSRRSPLNHCPVLLPLP